MSKEFENFLVEYGIEHRKSPPLWPAANGEIEAQNRSLVKMLKITKVEGKQWKDEREFSHSLQVYAASQYWSDSIFSYVW